MPYPLLNVFCQKIQNEFLGPINSMSSSIHEIQLSTVMSLFFTLTHIAFFFIQPFWLMVPISYSSLYLVCSTGQCSPLHCFFKTSYSLVFFPTNYFNFIPQGRWFPLSFHISLAIPDFLTSTWNTAFRCSSSLTFSGLYASPLYTLPQLYRMEYMQFIVMLYSVGGLTQQRYFWRVRLLINIVLISYGLHIFWIFSAQILTLDRPTVVSFLVLFSERE